MDADTGNSFVVSEAGNVDVVAGQGFGRYNSMNDYLSASSQTGEISSSEISNGFRDGRFRIAGGKLPMEGWPRSNRAKGGVVKGFASGGINRDNVPAMLMGGEYVLNKQSTDRYGTEFLDRLNTGQVSKFEEGGSVGMFTPTKGTAPIAQYEQGLNSDNLVRLLDVVEDIQRNIEDSVKEGDQTQRQGEALNADSSQGGMTNNVNITVNVSSEGNVEATAETTGGEAENEEGKKNNVEKSEKLADTLRGVVLDTIVQEQRPGGLLQKEL
jgi:hypothetical protein